jgi:putative acetyltransferase
VGYGTEPKLLVFRQNHRRAQPTLRNISFETLRERMASKSYQNYLIKSWEPLLREKTANLIKTVLTEYGLPWQPDEADIDVLQVEKYYYQVGGEFWVVEDTLSHNLVGTAAYYPINRGKNAVEIRKMYILPAHRGKGLGKYLLAELEKTIADKNYEQIWIETASVLKEAVGLYESNGYKATEGVETKRCDLVYVKMIKALLE